VAALFSEATSRALDS